MDTQKIDTNSEIIKKYTDQPATMPKEIRDEIESSWKGQPVQLYALADLDSSLNLTQTWVALGPQELVIVYPSNGNGREKIKSFPRSQIKALREIPGLSCTILTLLGETDQPALAILRYTHRQRRAIENIKYILEQQIQGTMVTPNDADEMYTHAISFGIKEAQASVTGNKVDVLWRLLAYLKPYRKQMIWGMIAASLMTIVNLSPPYITGRLIDNVIKPYQSGTLPMKQALHIAWLMILALAGIFILRHVFLWIRLRTMAVLGEYVAKDLRADLYEHLQKLSVSYYSSKQTGSIITRVSSDTDRIWDFVAFGIVEVSLSLITLIGLGIVLIYMDWPLGLIMTLPVPFFLYAIFRHGQQMQKLFLKAWRKWSNLTDVLSDTIPGIRVVKAFNQEEYEKGRFRKRNIDAINVFNSIHANWTSFWPVLLISIHAVMLTVWMVALPRIIPSKAGVAPSLTAGTFVSFLLYMTMFIQPIDVIGQMARMLNRATSSAHRIFEVLDTEPQIVDKPQPVQLSPVKGHVKFENVSFAYDGVRQVIKGISFEVHPGEMVGLVGPSGGGKTTVINLIARFYEVTGGKVLIDGVDLRDLDTGHYRRQVGMVLQDPYLFHGTVLDNIRYGVPETRIEQVIQAAKAANAHDFICKLAHGYDTIVGERGHTLSGGERQRVSIARAILCNPRILILDEATSSVDTETERKIQEALDRLVRGRTVFAIAHRLSTLTRANRLFVIADGKITEQGTHAELLNKPDGIYRKLHRMQQELHEIYAV
jgi:ATP-binding cassette, subfamily B, bacterial